MPVELKFSDNRRYLIYKITEPFDINDLMRAYEKEREYRDSVDYTLHSITDMSALRRVPPNWLTAKAGPGLTHPRSGSILLVGLTPGYKILLNTITKIMRFNRMQFFNTYAEAEAFMEKLIAYPAITRPTP
jgi:hypothetical protein